MKTGYFARASEEGHNACETMVHVVSDNKALCGYRPHKTMQFCFCAGGVYLPYVKCKKCKEKYSKYLIKEADKCLE